MSRATKYGSHLKNLVSTRPVTVGRQLAQLIGKWFRPKCGLPAQHAGVMAQIQGHKPSATAEQHYQVRPLELLRVHHERIQAWTLEQAEVPFVADVEPGKLRSVHLFPFALANRIIKAYGLMAW